MQDESQDQGSFLTGFTVGLLAGAAGYFLFATDKGEKVRRDLAQEWAAAQADVQHQAGEVTAQEMKGWLKQMVMGVVDAFRPEPKSAAKGKKGGAGAKNAAKKSDGKFKNTSIT